MATDILRLAKTSASPPTASFLLGCGAVFGILGGAADLTRSLGENALLFWAPAVLLACAALLCALRSGRNYAVALPFLYIFFALTWANASGVYSLILSEESYTVRLVTADRRELLLFCVFFLLDLMTLLLFTFADRGTLWKTMSCVTCALDLAFRALSHVLLHGADARVQPQIETVMIVLCAMLVLSAGLREKKEESASFGRLAMWETSPVPAIVCVAGGAYLAVAGVFLLLYFFVPTKTFPAVLSSLMQTFGISRAYLADGFGTVVLCFGLLGCLFALLAKSICGKAGTFSEFRPAPITALALIGGYRIWSLVAMTVDRNPPSALWIAIVTAAFAVDCAAVVLFCRADRSTAARVAAIVLNALAAVAAVFNPYDVAPVPVTRAVIFAVMALLCTTLRADPFVRARVSASALVGVLCGGLFSAASCALLAYMWMGGTLTVESALLALALLAIGILTICICAGRLVSYESTDAILSDISSEPFMSAPTLPVSDGEVNGEHDPMTDAVSPDDMPESPVSDAEDIVTETVIEQSAEEEATDTSADDDVMLTDAAPTEDVADQASVADDVIAVAPSRSERRASTHSAFYDSAESDVLNTTVSLKNETPETEACVEIPPQEDNAPKNGNPHRNLMDDPVTQDESLASVLEKLNEIMKTISAKDKGQSGDRSDKES